MQNQFRSDFTEKNKPLGTILKNVSQDAVELLRAELNIFKDEIKTVAVRAEKDARMAMLFTFLAAMSLLPLFAFAVIGLGALLGDRYWLSSLVVAVVSYALFSPLSAKYYKKLMTKDVEFSQTTQGLQLALNSVQEKLKDVLHSATQNTMGEDHESDQIH
jgi:uncharacterized membrane protein YqjE